MPISMTEKLTIVTVAKLFGLDSTKIRDLWALARSNSKSEFHALSLKSNWLTIENEYSVHGKKAARLYRDRDFHCLK